MPVLESIISTPFVSREGTPTRLYGTYALALLPASGDVDIPFASFLSPAGFPPIDFTRVHDVGITFRGSLIQFGTYVLDNFQATVIPEPSTLALLSLPLLGLLAKRVRGIA